MAYLMIWQRNKFTVAGNCEYKETDSIKAVQSYLKSHPLWVTLYLKFLKSVFFSPREPLACNKYWV